MDKYQKHQNEIIGIQVDVYVSQSQELADAQQATFQEVTLLFVLAQWELSFLIFGTLHTLHY